MKYFASLCALVLAGTLPGVAASAHTAGLQAKSHFQNQFHFHPSKHRLAQIAAHEGISKQSHALQKKHEAGSKTIAPKTQAHSVSSKIVRRHTAPTGKVGFLAATDIPSGGATWYPAYSGDFNGDGHTDIASEVYAWDNTSSAYIYQISVVLGNGDGTFQQPVLTPITNNDNCVGVLVADINGDGWSDVLIGHNPGACGNSYTMPTIDVLIGNGDGTFTTTTGAITISTSGLAGGTLALDTNGKFDLVLVDDNNPANLITVLGNGDGTFQAPSAPVALGGEAGTDVVIADLDGDGVLDVSDIDYNTQQVATYLSTSPTPYSLQPLLDTPDHNHSACSLTAGDLNNDGYPDLVTSNCSGSGNDITVYINNQNGTFGGSTPGFGVYYNGAMSGGTNSQPSDVETNAVAIADVNGDGKVDLVATNIDSSDITVLLGNGDGTFVVPTVGYAFGGYPWNWNNSVSGPATTPAIVADFNGDGFADIVVPDQQFSYAYLRGYGDGSFRAALDYYVPTSGYSWTYGIASGDFNHDGYTDFVIGNICGCTTQMGITVFLSNPDGTLQPGINFGSTSNFDYVAVADFNQDGSLDVVATDDSTGLVHIFNGDGTGNFAEGTPFQADLTNNSPKGIFVGDFNNDGFPDLVVANSGVSDVSVLINDKTGNFPTPVPITLNGSLSQGVAIADLGNGQLDIVAPLTYGSGAIAVLLGIGDGTFQNEVDYPIGASGPTSLALADLDGNGTLDVAVTLGQGGGQDIAIALGDGHGAFGSFSTPVPSSLQDYNLNSGGSGPGPMDIAAIDVDGDGYLDLVYTNVWYGTVGVLFGQGNATYFDPVEYPVGQTSWGFTTSDVNGDGKSDVLAASYDFAGVNVLLNNNGSGTLGTYSIALTSQSGTVSAGGTATYTFTVTPTKHYNGTVTFSCPTGLPALTSCSFTPSASVTLDGLNPQTVTLTITTKAPSTSSLRTRASVEPQSNPRRRSSAMLLASLNGIGVFGMFLAGGLNKKRTRWSVLAIFAMAMTFFLVGCGGSSNSTTPPPTKGDSTSNVTSSAATVLVGQQVTFTGTVSGASGTPTGTVTFLDGSTTLGTGTLTSGSATLKTSSLAAGVHAITITYGGDSNFNASASTAFSQTVDNPGTAAGSYPLTVSATGTAGTNGVTNGTQQVVVNLTVQ